MKVGTACTYERSPQEDLNRYYQWWLAQRKAFMAASDVTLTKPDGTVSIIPAYPPNVAMRIIMEGERKRGTRATFASVV